VIPNDETRFVGFTIGIAVKAELMHGFRFPADHLPQNAGMGDDQMPVLEPEMTGQAKQEFAHRVTDFPLSRLNCVTVWSSRWVRRTFCASEPFRNLDIMMSALPSLALLHHAHDDAQHVGEHGQVNEIPTKITRRPLVIDIGGGARFHSPAMDTGSRPAEQHANSYARRGCPR